MRRITGLELLDARAGTDRAAQKGEQGIYNTRLFLNRGHEVLLDERQASQLSASMSRVEGGVTMVDSTIVLGSRQAIADIEQALIGMKAECAIWRCALPAPAASLLGLQIRGMPSRRFVYSLE